ncbi:MAG: ribose-phosphate diphosphokinase [Candidatus Aenigmarchaeota archaeon]|nr:ribose-phosphate diphosphokinase [Candidatus Aenigmarchaeota archaeon]
MIILNGSKSTTLGEKIAIALGVKFEDVTTRVFPDGETYVRINTDVKGRDAVIIQTMFPNQNDSLMEFLLIADTLKDMGALKITGVVPYLAYARQDRRFQPGEALSIKTIAGLMKSVGIDRLITIDTHYQHVKPGEFDLFGIPCVNLSAGPLLLEHIKEKVDQDLMTIGPDLGSLEMVKYATGEGMILKKEKRCPICGKPATECKCRIKKKKYEITEIESEYDFSRKNVVILDDIIASGGTMIKAAKEVKSGGAKKVIAAATHGLFMKDSLIQLKELTDYLVVTDSISTPVSNVSVAPLIVKVLKKGFDS